MTELVRALAVSLAHSLMWEKLHLIQSGLRKVSAFVIVWVKVLWQLTFVVCGRGALLALECARHGQFVQSEAQCSERCRATER
jgi:EamA domain-containing membrane protein RarD